jgi:hypothetical protein
MAAAVCGKYDPSCFVATERPGGGAVITGSNFWFGDEYP